ASCLPLAAACRLLFRCDSVSSPALSFSLPPAPTDSYTLSLHDALPICFDRVSQVFTSSDSSEVVALDNASIDIGRHEFIAVLGPDRKSTRLNSSHVKISYAVFCLKKKKRETGLQIDELADAEEEQRRGR